jgi:2-succinyl-6-hydroxy-2,4-cyclohexadiene-1-carboxylate synthase
MGSLRGHRAATGRTGDDVRIVTDDGVALEVVEQGRGPALLLVHGFGGAKEDFSDQVDELARDHRVVTLDLRGHGGSDGPEDPTRYSLDRFAADLGNVLDALGIDACRLLGHSMGGMIVRRFVLASPHRVDALILMDTSPGPVPGLDADMIDLGVQIANEQGMAELKRVMDAFSPLDTPAYQRTLVERPGYREFGDAKWAALSRAMWVTMSIEIRDQPDQLAELAAVHCPTLVLVGVEDEPFRRVSQAMADTIAGAELVVIPDAGHSPQFENGAEWLATVQRFLARVETASPAV